MNTFNKLLPMNISGIGKEVISVEHLGVSVGSCKISREGYIVYGHFQLDKNVDMEQNSLQYQFVGGILIKICIERKN